MTKLGPATLADGSVAAVLVSHSASFHLLEDERAVLVLGPAYSALERGLELGLELEVAFVVFVESLVVATYFD